MDSLSPTVDRIPVDELSRLRLEADKHDLQIEVDKTTIEPERPDPLRRSTDPSTSSSPLIPAPNIPRSRSRSPYHRRHARSQSAASALMAPPMTRTRSLPIDGEALLAIRSHSHSPMRTSSPLRSSLTPKSTLKKTFDESAPTSPIVGFSDIEIIAEDSELDLTPRALAPREGYSSLPHSSPFSRSHSLRRRPASPLTQPAGISPGPPASPRPSTPSGSKFNEPYPQGSISANSSMPSTPTSLRSRSPSISSLETIPDTPDAEEAAMEAYQINTIKAAAEAAEASRIEAETEQRLRKVGLEAPSGSVNPSARDKRKRWSVCGAERRGDVEMETIWED